MKNFPRTINNKADITHLMSEMPTETNNMLQGLLDSKDVWLMTNKLEDGDAGVEDATHKVESVKDQDDVVTERYQYEFMEDPQGEIFRLGFASSSEVAALLAA